MPLTSCVGKITFNGTVVQGFLEKVCLSNGEHNLAAIARGHRELSAKSDSVLFVLVIRHMPPIVYENGLGLAACAE